MRSGTRVSPFTEDTPPESAPACQLSSWMFQEHGAGGSPGGGKNLDLGNHSTMPCWRSELTGGFHGRQWGMDALEGLCAVCARIPESSPLAAAQRPPGAGAAGGQTASTRASCMVGGQSSSRVACWRPALGRRHLASAVFSAPPGNNHQNRESSTATENGTGFKSRTEVQSPLLKTGREKLT